ncbi:MAG: hypothetical protein ACOYNY_42060 [Caldilineaceae bacterium]
MILQDLLATMPYRDLRGAATRLQRRQDRQHQKHDWITAIVTGWQTVAPPALTMAAKDAPTAE